MAKASDRASLMRRLKWDVRSNLMIGLLADAAWPTSNEPMLLFWGLCMPAAMDCRVQKDDVRSCVDCLCPSSFMICQAAVRLSARAGLPLNLQGLQQANISCLVYTPEWPFAPTHQEHTSGIHAQNPLSIKHGCQQSWKDPEPMP